jgi:hypothetical protein
VRHAAIEVGRVVVDHAVDAITHRGGEDLAIGDVQVPIAADRRDALDREGQIGVARAEQADLVGALHAGLEREHRFAHLGVVHRADVEVELLEGRRRHLGQLGH